MRTAEGADLPLATDILSSHKYLLAAWPSPITPTRTGTFEVPEDATRIISCASNHPTTVSRSRLVTLFSTFPSLC